MKTVSPRDSNTIYLGAEPNLTDNSESSEVFASNIYEFPETEDLSILRGRGFQKPKQMWMAKDQAHSVTKHFNYLSPSEPASFEEPANLESSQAPVTIDANDAPQTRLLYSLGSPLSNNVHGVAPLSSSMTNTSSSLSSHTPPRCGNGLSTAGSGSPCTSPIPIEPLQSCYNACFENVPEKVRIKLPYSVPAAAVVLNNNPPTTSRTGRRKQSAKSRIVKINDASHKGQPKITVRRRRQSKAAQESSKLAPLTLTLNLSSISAATHGGAKSRTLSPFRVSAVTTSSTPDPDSTLSMNHSGSASSPASGSSLNTNSVMGGLKIRLRRDSSLIEQTKGRNSSRFRTAPVKKASSFRIVESWCDTDAPGGTLAKGSSAASPSLSFGIGFGGLRVGDIVWAKLAGYPYWPSRITALWARTVHQLAQATELVPVTGSSSLGVLATPPDPALASGFTARVDWLAWDQWSYLSCSKLFPFLDSYDKLYNPRTRVKGYADAVRLAKHLITNQNMACHDGPTSAACSTQAVSLIGEPDYDTPLGHLIETQGFGGQLLHGGVTNGVEISSNNGFNQAAYPQTTLAFSIEKPSDALSQTRLSSIIDGISNDSALAVGCTLQQSGPLYAWDPLPQLDISRLDDFASHAPTFSEDEEETNDFIENEIDAFT